MAAGRRTARFRKGTGLMATLRFKRAGMLVAAVVPFAACSGGLELDEDARVE
jgi:hypothetical protein